MKIRYIPAGVALLAAAITCLICLMRDYDIVFSLEALLLVLIIFTAIGMKAQQIIVNIMHEQKMEEEERIRRAEFLEAERLRKIEEETVAEEENAEENTETEESELQEEEV